MSCDDAENSARSVRAEPGVADEGAGFELH
jgi:hypothetical protein